MIINVLFWADLSKLQEVTAVFLKRILKMMYRNRYNINYYGEERKRNEC